MKKLLTLILVILLFFVGCKENTNSSVVDQNQTTEVLNDQNEQDIQRIAQEPETKNSLIKDNIPELNNDVLKEIVESYFLVSDFDTSFNEQDLVDYEKAFHYIMSAGSYPIQPFEYWTLFENYYNSETGDYTIPVDVVNQLILEKKVDASWFANLSIKEDSYIVETSDNYMLWTIRPELYQYFNIESGMMTVPANIVEEYILSKFNTTIDSSRTVEYNKESDTYTFYPFTGEFYYDISIDEVIEHGKIVKFTSTLTNTVEENPIRKYQAIFAIELIDEEFRFLSVATKEMSR